MNYGVYSEVEGGRRAVAEIHGGSPLIDALEACRYFNEAWNEARRVMYEQGAKIWIAHNPYFVATVR